MGKSCAIEGCFKPVSCRGWCSAHYHRWQRYGDPLGGRRLRPTGRTDTERFIDFITPVESGCWEWNGALANGYGAFRAERRTNNAHLFAYEMWVGPIPDGFQVDHTCHNNDAECSGGSLCRHRRCVNPDHLEAVTQQVNIQRGNGGKYWAAKTHCPQGHKYTADNIYWSGNRRTCKACTLASGRARNRKV